MTWNYRLFKQDTPKSAVGRHIFFIGECYYNDAGKPDLYSGMDHNELNGDTAEEAKEVYEQMAEAFKQPVIGLDDEGNFK